jgi:PAS domain S-box-containing protein
MTLPTLIFVLGVLASIATTALVPIHRRRSAAVRLTDELRRKNLELDALIAEQRRVAEHVRSSEQHYRQLVELLPDMIALQTDGRIVFINRTGAELVGVREPEHLVGAHVRDILELNGDAQRILEPRSEDFSFHNQRLRRLDGTTIDIELASLATTHEGQPASHLVLRDITERTRAEIERARLEEQLQQAQKLAAVGRLAGGIAHDFNNLLTVIRGYGELLLASMHDDAQRRKDVEEIVRAAAHSSSLTRQLLAFSRRQVFEEKLVDLNEVVGDMERMLTRLIGDDVALISRLDPELSLVKADETRIEQVIANLVINASDALPKGGTVTIETRMACIPESSAPSPHLCSGSYVVLSVSDNGIGMDDDTMARAFEPFFTTKAVAEGTGLGLAIVYGTVKQCGGEIRVESARGKGTTFRIFLPAASAEIDELAPADASGRLTGDEVVLLVEDNDQVRELAERALGTRGYAVVSTSSAADALETARTHEGPIHLLVTDVVMPEMSGIALATSLRDLRPSTRVLFMSGYTERRIELDYISEAEIPFIAKPFAPRELVRVVRDTLDAPLAAYASCAGAGDDR